MTLAELLDYLDRHSGVPVLNGTVADTIRAAEDGTHPNRILAEIILALREITSGDAPEYRIERAGCVKALGPLRLRYMADDAPVEGFRTVDRAIQDIDAAFNEEVLRERGK